MKKSRLWMTIVSLALVAIVGVGSTFAYLSDKTEPIENIITLGDVDIDLEEPSWDPEGDDQKNMLPGSSVAKDPQITNTGSNDGYMILQVDGADFMREKGFEMLYGETTEAEVIGYNTESWILVDEEGNIRENEEGLLLDGYYVYTAGALAPEATTDPLFTRVLYTEEATGAEGDFTVVGKYQAVEDGEYYTSDELIEKGYTAEKGADGKFPLKYFVDGQSFDTYEAAEAYLYENYEEEITDEFELVLTAYAIQSANIDFRTDTEPYQYEWVAMALAGDVYPAEEPQL